MNRKKMKRSAKHKSYYEHFDRIYSGKVIRRRGERDKRVAAAKEHPEIGSPSQLRKRGIKIYSGSFDTTKAEVN